MPHPSRARIVRDTILATLVVLLLGLLVPACRAERDVPVAEDTAAESRDATANARPSWADAPDEPSAADVRAPWTPNAPEVPGAPDASDTRNAASPTNTDDDAAASPLRRVALVGASATYGFGARLTPPDPDRAMSKPCGLDDVLSATLVRPDAVRLKRFANLMFFRNPLRIGSALAGQARRSRPTLVIGVDFLFWYGYGNNGADGGRLTDERGRLALLEKGLAQLDQFECPIVVGDFPDMSAAVGGMISAAQMPAPDTLAALNARVHEWADARPHVHVVPLARFLDDLRADRRLAIGDHVWPAGSTRVLLQRDQLHPTVEGQIALIQLVADALHRAALGIDAETFDADGPRVLERLEAEHFPRPGDGT